MSKTTIAVATAFLLSTSVPAIAGEVTGSGKDIDINGRSECAFSGLNDLDGDPRDPGFISQSYGQNVRLLEWDPQSADPVNGGFPPVPGFSCNPNRGRDLHGN